MKRFLLLLLTLLVSMTNHSLLSYSQRHTDKLDRGLVAVPASTGTGYLVSWRVLGEEYYGVTYNLYRDGTKVNTKPLSVSNYTDRSGKTSNSYQVAAVVNGVEQAKCTAVKPWANGYLDVPVSKAYSRNNADVTSDYYLNDVTLGDVNGDGVAELMVKRNYSGDILTTTDCFHHYDCYDVKGNLLWWIDLGPNMISGPDEQYDLVSYDWDEDGKAEVLMRGVDNMIIHTSDGQTIQIGSKADTRSSVVNTANMTYTNQGNEYLLYLDGSTAIPYQIGPSGHPNYIDYPLARGNASDWGDGYGHRSSKHYFGAPFLDGRHASIFLGRGCYTKHHMAAYDVDKQTHKLTLRWDWKSDGLNSIWYGQGYHNYAIADVDMDGRDEIVFGSMVIDDNGKGLSSTGLGHGDAQHCGDFDPYRWGLEQFACNEDQPCMNYRNATTSQIYYRIKGTNDDGRALCANFCNDIPGACGRSVGTDMISCVADKEVSVISNIVEWGNLNSRIYWDGDLCDEVLNSPGIERAPAIFKPGGGRIFLGDGSLMDNWSKNNPGAEADLYGDWREEIVTRTSDNKALRIYTTPIETSYRLYTLWHDHQYRNSIVWQPMGYNQPPHVSYFVGQLEGITIAPPPLTNEGRVEVANGGTIGTDTNNQHVMVCEVGNSAVTVGQGASPSIMTFNVPSWVQGNNNNNGIKYEYYTCNVAGSAFTGNTRLVKQGEGKLVLPSVVQDYTGNTDIWGGTLQFDGSLLQSHLWLNRFTTLLSDGGQFRNITADYASTIKPGGADHIGCITADTLNLGFGSRILFDLGALSTSLASITADQINVKRLKIETKNWEYGPQYKAPVFEFHCLCETLTTGRYLLAEIETVTGQLETVKLEGLPTDVKSSISYEDGKLYLDIKAIREPASIVWNGGKSSIWNFADAENFTLGSATEADSKFFVTGDTVTFDDSAQTFKIDVSDDVEPAALVFANETKDYTLSGEGAITGAATFTKTGAGKVTMSGDNTFTGGVKISGGTVSVSSLANSSKAYGGLGAYSTNANNFIIENGATLQTTANVSMDSPFKVQGTEGGVINASARFDANKLISGTVLTKKGSGTLNLYQENTGLKKLVIAGGVVAPISNGTPAVAVEFQNGTLNESSGGSSFAVNVPEGGSGTWNLTERANHTNKLTGSGKLTVYIPALSNYEGTARTSLSGNWSAFTGTLKATTYSNKVAFTFNNSNGLPKATLDIQSGRIIRNASGLSFTIGKVTGDGGYLGGPTAFRNGVTTTTVTWKVGNDENWVWGGSIIENCNFTKVGNGKLTLKGSGNTFTGAAKVEAGELHFSSGTVLGTGTLTVNKGATLSGVCSTSKTPLTNSSTTINGTVEIGILAGATSGIIYFSDKPVNFTSSSTLVIGAKKCATASNTGGTSIQNISKLTMNGTVSVHVADNHTLAVGDSIILWKATTFAGNPKLENEVIDVEAGLFWDASDIKKGILRVTSVVPAAIRDLDLALGQKLVEVFTLSGTKVGSYLVSDLKDLSTTGISKTAYILRITDADGSKKTMKYFCR